jgi:hypothetical protein
MITVYHANEHRGSEIIVYAEGSNQWLGDAYYFWQDFEFVEEWAKSPRNKYSISDIYTVELDLNFDSDEDVIDTVFNENDYYKFVEKIEYFANKYFDKFKEKPSLQEFNNFINDNNFPLWKGIKAIRFQDLPSNDKKDFLKVKGFFYKKRIQLALYDETKFIKKMVTHTIENKNFKNG